MKVRKIVLAFSLLVVLVLALAGCGESSSTASTGSDSGSAAADTTGSGTDADASGNEVDGRPVIGVFEGADPGDNAMRFELFEDGTFTIIGDENGTARTEPGTWELSEDGKNFTFTYDNMPDGVFQGWMDVSDNLTIRMGAYEYTLDRVM